MSFNGEIKKELSGLYCNKECCEKATLATYYAVLAEEKKTGIYITTENLNITRRINILTKKILGFDPETQFKLTQKKEKSIFSLKIANGENTESLKKDLCLISPAANIFFSRIEPTFTLSQCCKIASIRAAFLSCGLISSPKKSYHLEFVTHKKQVCDDLYATLTELNFQPKISKRRNSLVIYIKNIEEICRFLSMLGAKRSLLKFYEIKSEKHMKNIIVRQMNCENANENKTINSAVIQSIAIKKLKKTGLYASLPSDLKKTAQLRLDNPQASLSELVVLADFQITKSGLNHRLKKIITIAQM